MKSLKIVACALFLSGLLACKDTNSSDFNDFCDKARHLQETSCRIVKVQCTMIFEKFSSEIIEAISQCGNVNYEKEHPDLLLPDNVGYLPCCVHLIKKYDSE